MVAKPINIFSQEYREINHKFPNKKDDLSIVFILYHFDDTHFRAISTAGCCF